MYVSHFTRTFFQLYDTAESPSERDSAIASEREVGKEVGMLAAGKFHYDS